MTPVLKKSSVSEEEQAHNISTPKTVNPGDISLFKTVVLRALADETRQGIILLLGRFQSMCVNDLAAYFNVSRPTVSHHLHVLHEARIVRSVRIGKEIHYSLHKRYLKKSISSVMLLIDSIQDSQIVPNKSKEKE